MTNPQEGWADRILRGGGESMSDVFSRLHPQLQSFLSERGWNPTPVQEQALPQLIDGKERLLIAPTGSGKTLAAVLPLLHRCKVEEWKPLSILYITPLRALNRDVDRRLAELSEALGLRFALRHGDTPTNERSKQVRRPPHLLVTTPETFQLMFTGHRLRAMLSSVQAVIIDEVHDLAGSERGWQLRLGLQRLEALCGRTLQKVGLSATVGNPDQVAAWISNESCQPIIAPAERSTVLTVETAPPLAEDEIGAMEMRLSPRAHATFRLLSELVENDPPCLVFVNSRNAAETVAQRLQSMAPQLNIGVHHGSLAAETRQEMEANIRNGALHALICTSSLELGIDVGSIRKIVQLESPRSVDRMLQRVGRADHRIGGIGRGHLLAWETDGIAESAVIAHRSHLGFIEDVVWRNRPYSIAANQIMLMAHSFKVVRIDDVHEIFSQTEQFEDWTRKDTENVLAVLADRWLLRYSIQPNETPWYRWPKHLYIAAKEAIPDGEQWPDELPRYDVADEDIPVEYKGMRMPVPRQFKDGWIASAGRTRKWVEHHLSMIPDKQSYRVRDVVTRRTIGNVDEAFVLELNGSGEEEDGRVRQFVMAGRTWTIVDADPEQSEVLVAPVSIQGEAPTWVGELPPVPAVVARNIGRLRRLIAEDFGLIEAEENEEIDVAGLLAHDGHPLTSYPLDGEAIGLLADTITRHIDATQSLPDQQTITIEQRSEALVINMCQGTLINETIGHLLLAMASTRTGRWGGLMVEATRIHLTGAEMQPEDVLGWLNELPADGIEGLLSVTLPNSRQVRWRFAQVAKTFGILQHGVDPRKINLAALVRRYRGTIVLEEVLNKLYDERMDIAGAKDVLRGIQSGLLNVVVTPAGPLGLSDRSQRDLLLPNWDNEAVRARLRIRLMNERAVLCCLKCRTIRRFRVERYPELKDPHACISCQGLMLVCAREGLEKMLEGWVASEEESDRNRMIRNASLVKTHGFHAIVCLMARGVGEATAQRILRKGHNNNIDSLLQSIHHAEIEYARTRRFWG